MTHKVLFLTDSLGLPRPDQTVFAHQTWCQLVAKNLGKNYELFFQLHGGLHTKMLMLLRNQGYLAGYQADTVILQIGIVDCSARVLSERVKKIISVIPIFSTIIRKIVKRYHRQLSTFLNIKYVDEDLFRKNLQALKSSFSASRFIVIPIAPPTKGFVKMMPRISQNIQTYNEILAEIFGEYYMSSIYSDVKAEDILLSDHYHLNQEGHEYLYKKVFSQLS